MIEKEEEAVRDLNQNIGQKSAKSTPRRKKFKKTEKKEEVVRDLNQNIGQKPAKSTPRRNKFENKNERGGGDNVVRSPKYGMETIYKTVVFNWDGTVGKQREIIQNPVKQESSPPGKMDKKAEEHGEGDNSAETEVPSTHLQTKSGDSNCDEPEEGEIIDSEPEEESEKTDKTPASGQQESAKIENRTEPESSKVSMQGNGELERDDSLASSTLPQKESEDSNCCEREEGEIVDSESEEQTEKESETPRDSKEDAKNTTFSTEVPSTPLQTKSEDLNCCEPKDDEIVENEQEGKDIQQLSEVPTPESAEEAKIQRKIHIDKKINEAIMDVDAYFAKTRGDENNRKKTRRLFLPTAFTEDTFDEFVVKQLYARFNPTLLTRHFDENGLGLGSGTIIVDVDKEDEVAEYAKNRSWKAQRLIRLLSTHDQKDVQNIKIYMFAFNYSIVPQRFCNDLVKFFGARNIVPFFDKNKRFISCVAEMGYVSARRLLLDRKYTSNGKETHLQAYQVDPN